MSTSPTATSARRGARSSARSRCAAGCATGAASASCSPASRWRAPIAGDHDEAERLVGEARDLFRRAGDRWGLVNALWRTADLGIARGRLDEAEGALRDALDVLGAARLDRWIGHTLAGLGELALLRGDPGLAARHFAEARERYAAKDDRRGIAAAEERLRACEGAAKAAQSAPG